MTIQRVPAAPFAQIANDALRDKRLTFRARGILAMVLSHTGEWDATREWLMRQAPEGRDAIQTALNELTALGYRVVTSERTDGGEVRTVVVWKHTPDGAVFQSPAFQSGSIPVGQPASGQETRPPIEDHPSEHHLREDQQVLVAADAPTETLGQQVNRITTIYTDLVPLSKFPAVAGIVRKALGAEYPEATIVSALQRLASEGRPVTVDSMRVEMDGWVSRSPASRTERKLDEVQGTLERAAARDAQRERRAVGQ